MLSSDLSEVVLERFWGFSGFCLSNFSSISLSFAAVSTGLAPPKIELFVEGAASTGADLLANCNFGLSRGPSVNKKDKILSKYAKFYIH